MAPSEKELVAALCEAVLSTFNGADRALLTVKKIREKVEEELELGDGFFSKGAWKEKAKVTIRTYAQELMDAEEAGAAPAKDQPAHPAKVTLKENSMEKGIKRASQEQEQRPKKRQKKEATSISEEVEEPSPEESEEAKESEFGESNESDTKAKKKSKTRKQVKGSKRGSNSRAKVLSDEDDEDEDENSLADSEESDAPRKKKATKSKSKQVIKAPAKRQLKPEPKVVSDSEDDDEEPDKDERKTTRTAVVDSDAESTPEDVKAAKKDEHRSQFKKTPSTESLELTPVPKDADMSDDDMSDVKDPEPKPKCKRRSKMEMADPSSKAPTVKAKKEKAPKQSKAPKVAKSKAPAVAKDLTEDEQLIKTLQSQLKKCGVNKIWPFELKQYGDDNKAKLRHLQTALKEIGMTGRFSEARAREIKEMRELQAELEAVKEGEKSWGLESGRRASRGGSKKKNLKEDSDDDNDEQGEGDKDEDDDDNGKGDSESGSEQPKPARRNARASLAFLVDEDSDE